MQRIFNMEKWQQVPDGQSVNFGHNEPRRIRIDVNAPVATGVYYADGNGVITFIARVIGRDVLEFFAGGEFALSVEGGPLWISTVDGEDISFEPSTMPTLTKLAERRPRNPEFELMQYHANRNIELRMERMRRELDEEWNRRIAPSPAPAEKPAPASSGKGGSGKPPSEPVPDGDTGEPDGADGGSGTGDAKK